MRIAILSRTSRPTSLLGPPSARARKASGARMSTEDGGLHSIRRLLHEARALRIQADVVNPVDCQIVIDGRHSRIIAGTQILPHYDAVLPRIGASITEYGLAVVNHFEALGVYAVNSARAIAESRNKLRSLQVLTAAGLPVPPSVLTRSPRNLKGAVDAVRGLPVVMKVLRGTQGVGVMLIGAPITLRSVLETLRTLDQDVLLQRFIAEGAGRDYRVFVVGTRVIAAMRRTAAPGEFRSNIHMGGQGNLVTLPPGYERMAIRAAKVFGLGVAGVDLMESSGGPLILEVNSSPGFEGIEKATGLNVARAILQHVQRSAAERRAHPRRRPRPT